MTLTYRQEYSYGNTEEQPPVKLIQEWLASNLTMLENVAGILPDGEYKLMAHCTEKTSAAPSIKNWRAIFSALGQKLDVVSTGCCGMSGTYGHEADNYDTSRKIYEMSWADVVNNPENKGKLVATGYSCRSQVKRQDEQQLPHPVQVLLDVVQRVS